MESWEYHFSDPSDFRRLSGPLSAEEVPAVLENLIDASWLQGVRRVVRRVNENPGIVDNHLDWRFDWIPTINAELKPVHT